jgi:4-(2-carboxyphenyl)-2-oxobut-3-enoate aldolase
MTTEELSGILGYMLTPTEDEVDAKSGRVNVEESARAADCLIRDGVNALCLNGTFGEVASLTWNELRTFTATVVDAAAGRVPVFAGATTLNTRDTVERAKAFADLGARGLMLGRPMMSSMSDEGILGFYSAVAEALPSMAIVIYDDAEAFKRPITTAVYRELAKNVPQVIASKYRSRLLVSSISTNSYNADLDAVGSNIKLLPGEFDWYFAYRLFDVKDAWSSFVCGGPAPVRVLRGYLQSGDWESARAITREIAHCYDGLIPGGTNFEVWHTDKIPFMKARFGAAGYMDPGPALPPYEAIREDRKQLAAECGHRSKEMQAKYERAS